MITLAVASVLLLLANGLISVENNVEAVVEDTISAEDITPADPTLADSKLVIFTVATEENDPFLRFVRSLKIYNLDASLEVRI